MRLTDLQIERYSRQIILREVGGSGQAALLAARIAVHGSGAAFQTAVTYLAGAGVGTLDLVHQPLASPGLDLPFPAPSARNAEIRCRTVLPGELEPGDYDVVLALSDGRRTVPAPQRRAARGSVALRGTKSGGLEVALVPASHGCIACLPWPENVGQDPFDPSGVVDLASAGALAALAACRWVLGLDQDDGPRLETLAAGDAVWLESRLALRPSCPRGCPPRAQAL